MTDKPAPPPPEAAIDTDATAKGHPTDDRQRTETAAGAPQDANTTKPNTTKP